MCEKEKQQHKCMCIVFIVLFFNMCCFVCLFGLMLNVPVNNFSAMLGRSHRFLGITSTFFFFFFLGGGGG